MRINMWKIVFTILILPSFLFAESIIGKVVSVTDGDTIKILDDENKLHKIRLADIDAPEKKQAYGAKSKENLSKYIAGEKVRVEYKSYDMYKRILGTVYLDKKDINKQQIIDGYAWVYRKYSKNNEYINQERISKNQKRGLWKDSDPLEPWEYRKNKKEK